MFLLVLVVPELVSSWTADLLPGGWTELTSIPAALTAVRVGFASPIAKSAPLARALAGLAAVVTLSVIVAMTRIRGAEDEATR